MAGLAIAYAMLAKIVLGFFAANGVVSIVWPSSGLAVASLLIGGKKYWPGVFIGALAGNIMQGSSVGVSIFIASGNTLEALTCFWLLARISRFNSDLTQPRDYLWLGVMGALGSCVSAVIGVSTLLLAGILTKQAVAQNLLQWWQGDMLGIFLVTPLILVWRHLPYGWFRRERMVEAIAFSGLAFFAGQIIFLGWFHDVFGVTARGYWVFLFVTWGAVRFGRHGALLVIGMTAVQMLMGMVLEVGGSTTNQVPTGLLNFWLYILVVTGVGILLALVIDKRKQSDARLHLQDAALKAAANAIVITDIDGVIEWTNPAFTTLTGFSLAETLGKRPKDLVKSGLQSQEFYEEMWQTLLAGGVWHGELHNRKKSGDLYWCLETISPIKDEKGHISNFILVTEDISELKHAESTIEHLAYFDLLTNLPNRRLFRDRLEQAVIGTRRDGDMLAVMHLNLDRFKLVNDTLGHEAGDQLLKTIAELLANSLREGDAIARLSGDEFMVVAQHLAHSEDAVRVAEKIVEALQPPFVLHEHEFFISTSIGISIFPTDTDDIDTLFKNADIALHQAKDAGRNNFRFFSADMNVATLDLLELETELRHALQRNEFILHYQPQIDIASSKTVGVEALIRWMHPERGLVPPFEFIPLAEETGLILPLSEWVLKAACTQMREWQDAGLPAVRVAVNLSARHFRQPGLVATVARILQETRLEPKYLELEITEGTIMLNVERTITVLHELKALGVELSVADFGTGYSSLSYLKRFPVNTLKIDRSFVNDVTTDPEDASLAKAIIAMAHSLHLRVIAEGVETEGQLAFLTKNSCDEIQGYFFSRPLPANECAKFLQQSRLPQAGGRKPEERTLLLVDDEVNIATSLKRMLRGDGYHILTATSGMEGLELLATHPVGVIISDQRMPEMTGVEFLRRVKQLYPDTVRIVLSGYTDLKSITDAINEGAIYKFLTKPWEDEQLRAQVHEAFQHFELKQENVRLGHEIERANSELSEVNHNLERRVVENTQEISRNINVLQVSQEVLEHLPTAVIGIDEDGLIVMANHQANALFDEDGSLIGCEARERLPTVLIDCMEGVGGGAHVVTLSDNRSLRVVCHRMGEMCRSKGTVMVISPVENVEAPYNVKSAVAGITTGLSI